MDPAEASVLNVIVAPGGAEAILKHYGPTAMASSDNLFIYLDGDQKHVVDEITDPNSIAPDHHSEIDAVYKREIGFVPSFQASGGNDQSGAANATLQMKLRYLTWLRSRLSYLPRQCPEAIIAQVIDESIASGSPSSKSIKSELLTRLNPGAAELTSQQILGLQRVALAQIPASNSDLTKIREQLKQWLSPAKAT